MLSGVIVIDKPKGVTSFKMVQWARRCLKVKRIGHTGTLDPIATGVLPLCVGRATKLVQFIMAGNKQYEGIIRLGISTDSYDAFGKIIEKREVPRLDIEQVKAIAKDFIGKQMQVPPPYSAAKYKGTPLYKFARKGIEIKKKPKEIEIFSFDILELKDSKIKFKIYCTKGTYVRSIVHEFGLKLGCGAHLESLTRIKSGPFSIDRAYDPKSIERAITNGELNRCLITEEEALSHIPCVIIPDDTALALRQGRAVSAPLIEELVELQEVDTKKSKFLRLVKENVKPNSENNLELVAMISWPPDTFNNTDRLKTLRVWV